MTRRGDLPRRVLEFVRERDLVPTGARMLVAVSGGADSVVLLHCLVRVRAAIGADLVVGHVDHGLRAGSADDAVFAGGVAAALGLPFASRREDVAGAARGRGLSVEHAGREVRYEALQAMAREAGAGLIATGHTATDQAETVLLRLTRGTGPLGLAGVRARHADGLVRPLLCATREEVRAWGQAHDIQWRDDPSNDDPRHDRNRVRAEVLPALRALNPRLDLALAGLAEDTAELVAWIETQAAAAVVEDGAGGFVAAASGPLQPYALIAAWERASGSRLGLARTHLDALVRLARSGMPGAELHLPAGVTARLASGGVRLAREGRRRRT